MSEKKIYGLVGFPLGHSFSKAFFNKKFSDEGLHAEYRNYEIPQIKDFPAIISGTPCLCGLNVTIPYKEQVIPYLTGLDPDAESIGAVNVVKIVRDTSGEICGVIGYNSDMIGFMESIRPLLDTSHKKALVLGTGGAAKAVRQGLIRLGLDTVYVSRNPGDDRLAYDELDADVMSAHTVIINATPLGMHPKVNACPPLPYNLITPAHVCYDVVYNPDVTLFMRKCAEHGAAVKNGLEMLHLQAVAAWEIWQK